MTDSVKQHGALCCELNNLYARKNHDYGDSFHQSFLEDGLVMSKIRLGDKFQRFKTLIKTDQQVPDESIRDTLIDMANYALMTVMELDCEKSVRVCCENCTSCYANSGEGCSCNISGNDIKDPAQDSCEHFNPSND